MSVCVQVPSTLHLSPQHQHCHDDSDPECISEDPMEHKRMTHSAQRLAFKAELEGVVGHLNKKSKLVTHLISPQSQSGVCVVNDLHLSGCHGYSRLERQNRCKLAALLRLMQLYGWTSLTHTQITARVSKGVDQILTLPLELSYSEATAASLVKMDLSGSVLDCGVCVTGQPVLGSLLRLHTQIYTHRPEVRCVIHTHTPSMAAVSSMKCGLLPLSHAALLLGEAAYCSLTGSDVEEGEELQRSLGLMAKVLVLRGHGVLALGQTLEEAFHIIYHCQQACDIQVKAMSCAGGIDKLLLLDRNAYKEHTHTPSHSQSYNDIHSSNDTHTSNGTHTSDTHAPGVRRPVECEASGRSYWKTGEAEFEALMRMMDRMGYQTGYSYRHPVIKEMTRSRSAIEIPATCSSRGRDMETQELLWRPTEALLWREAQLLDRQQPERALWLTSPNNYLKESHTTWRRVQGTSSCRGTPNHFVPLNTHPSEVMQIRKKIRAQHWVDMMTAGPQSERLSGVPPDKEPGPAYIYDDESDKLLPPNPFSQSDEELEEYKSLVEQHQSQQDDVDATEAEEMSTFGSTLSLSLSLNSPAREVPPLADLEEDLSESSTNMELDAMVVTETPLENNPVTMVTTTPNTLVTMETPSLTTEVTVATTDPSTQVTPETTVPNTLVATEATDTQITTATTAPSRHSKRPKKKLCSAS